MSFRILHVDDDPLMRDLVALSLGLDPAFVLLSAHDAEAALAMAAEAPPDLILCDVAMPGTDGPALLARLKAEPRTAGVPVVFMTARAPAEEIDRLTALGAVGVIVKPFETDKLAGLVRRHLQVAKLASASREFAERLTADAAALAAFRAQLDGDGAALPDGLHTCVHKLAGAAGVFDFKAVSTAASQLEEEIVTHGSRAGDGNGAIAAKLDRLLATIAREQARDAGPIVVPKPAPPPPVARPKSTFDKPHRLVAKDRALRVLIADDDPAIVKLLAERCARMGFAVDTATNGMQLLIKARRERPDILIVDVNMPEADGISVSLRFLDPGSDPIEVVVITGGTDPETVERCESLGMFYGQKGPTFWTDIDAALAEICPDMADRISAAAAADGEVPRHPRVLVIDSDPSVCAYFARRLGKCGIDVLTAPDNVQGVRIAAREQPSVILTDYLMPDGDAEDLLQRLRGSGATENIPVLVMSARRLSELAEHYLTREFSGHPGALRVLQKSRDNEEIFSALQKYCGFEKSPLYH